MHTYRKTEERLWTVGFICEHDPWHAIADFNKEEDAARYTNYLNGGSQEPHELLDRMRLRECDSC